MGLINKLFGGSKEPKIKKEEKILPWLALTHVSQFETIKKNSKIKSQLIFKHSTRCGISKMVMNQFVETYDLEANIDLFY